jgi:flavin reductase (DIM6/NTAB) family NADH-FMN oxidoreductase RutF
MSALFKIPYGLYLLTAKGERDNGCIINTVSQVTAEPNRIMAAIGKKNLTHDLVHDSGIFCVSVLEQKTPMSIFEHFGFQSGRTADKFAQANYSRDGAGNIYLNDYANAYISAKVISSADMGTHTVFFADVTESAVLSDVPSLTYEYYHAKIKPKPRKAAGWVCKICGYVHDDDLPDDFLCPLCNQGAEYFEKMGL